MVEKIVGQDSIEYTLRDHIRHVVALREIVDQRTMALAVKKKEWEDLHDEEIRLLHVRRADLAIAEDALRKATVEAFEATGNKHPAPGVGIRMTRQIAYSEEDAIRWAINHGHTDLLKLNYKPFEQAAKVLDLNFVTVTEVPEATIARELVVE